MEIIKIAVVGIIGVLLAIQFKSYRPEFSLLITFVTCLLIFSLSVQYFEGVVEMINTLGSVLKENASYLKIILKVIGITYICEFCSGICKDSGYSAIGNQIEVFGKLSILLAGLPIVITLIETIQTF